MTITTIILTGALAVASKAPVEQTMCRSQVGLPLLCLQVPSAREHDRVSEKLRLHFLKSTQRMCDFIEANLGLFEMVLQSDILSASDACELRIEMEEHKAKLSELRIRARELWEQQPGGITAPPPRPKGKKFD